MKLNSEKDKTSQKIKWRYEGKSLKAEPNWYNSSSSVQVVIWCKHKIRASNWGAGGKAPWTCPLEHAYTLVCEYWEFNDKWWDTRAGPNK